MSEEVNNEAVIALLREVITAQYHEFKQLQDGLVVLHSRMDQQTQEIVKLQQNTGQQNGRIAQICGIIFSKIADGEALPAHILSDRLMLDFLRNYPLDAEMPQELAKLSYIKAQLPHCTDQELTEFHAIYETATRQDDAQKCALYEQAFIWSSAEMARRDLSEERQAVEVRENDQDKPVNLSEKER